MSVCKVGINRAAATFNVVSSAAMWKNLGWFEEGYAPDPKLVQRAFEFVRFRKTKAPNAGPGALANLIPSAGITQIKFSDLFSGLATTPKD